MTTKEIYEKLGTFAGQNAGDEAHAWVLAHAQEFPEEVRDEIVFQFSVDAMLKDSAETSAIDAMKKQGLEAMDAIERIKSQLQDRLRVLDLKDQLAK